MIIFVFLFFLAFWPFPWQRQPFWKNQPLKAQLHMAYDIPSRFHKVWSGHLREMCRTNFWWKKERKKERKKKKKKNNKKWSKHNMFPKLCLGNIINNTVKFTKKNPLISVTEHLIMPLQLKFEMILTWNKAVVGNLRIFYF